MYRVPHYQVTDQAVVLDFMREYPLATLVGVGADGAPVATFVPVLIEERGEQLILRGHIARNSDHHHGYLHNPNVLALFSGPNCGVKASWYLGDPMSGGTWNYMTAHARGTLRFLDEPGLRTFLRDLTTLNEAGDTGSNFDDLPVEYVDKLVKAVIAFELDVTSLNGVFKLSQNKDDLSFANVAKELAARGGFSAMIAEQMKGARPELF